MAYLAMSGVACGSRHDRPDQPPSIDYAALSGNASDMRLASFACAIVLVASSSAAADEPVPETTPEGQPETTESGEIEDPGIDRPMLKPLVRTREIVVEVPGERSRNNKLVVGSVLLGGALVSGVGVLYHLRSRDAADAVSADEFTGRPWTDANEALVQRAADSRRNATIAYGVGGALLVGGLVVYIATAPSSTKEVLRPHLAFTKGGATVGGEWSW